MLHEILLALTGHPSALFEADTEGSKLAETPFPLLSPPEAALLSSIGRLATLHRQLRAHTTSISSSHPSTICRAIASAISSSHLSKFQQKVSDVESQILRKDASSVGAYNIVPLAGVVKEFDEWNRLMEWYWSIACYMQPWKVAGVSRRENDEKELCSGALIIDKLRQEAQTGYPDVEQAAFDLAKVAETAWLRQLSTWVLYGRLPSIGAQDFFIQIEADGAVDGQRDFYSNNRLLPKLVSAQTASSILFIGRSLNHVRTHGMTDGTSKVRLSTTPELALLPVHLKYLSALASPISSSALSDAVSAIRLSLSRNALQLLLPLHKIVQMLSLLQEFFLLGRGEFAMALITEADERIRTHNRTTSQNLNNKHRGVVQGLLIKEGEVGAVLDGTWAALSSYNDDVTDGKLDLAHDLIRLSIHKRAARHITHARAKDDHDHYPSLSSIPFDDVLLPVPTVLGLHVPPPLDLFLTDSDMDIYSATHSYLLAIRRSHMHLANLWRQSPMRRDHPAPLGPPQSGLPSGQKLLKARRARSQARVLGMRKVWATCGAAVFLLSETGAYFEGEVVQCSWKHFHDWISSSGEGSGGSSRPHTSMSIRGKQVDMSVSASLVSRGNTSPSFISSSGHPRSAPHDPEALASAHRLYLATLVHALLLTDTLFTRALKTFFTHVDELVAFTNRLQIVQQNRDLEEDEGVVDALANYVQEEKEVLLELDRSRKRVDSDMKGLLTRLREIDAERIGAGGLPTMPSHHDDGYTPLKVGGVDRLLMKLDFGSSIDEDASEGVNDYT